LLAKAQAMLAPRHPLRTPRRIVRAIRAEDAGDLHAYLSDPQTYSFEPGAPITCDNAAVMAAEMAAEMATSPHFWAVEATPPPRAETLVWQAKCVSTHCPTWQSHRLATGVQSIFHTRRRFQPGERESLVR
jgi:RimJ/RimL family protein N-acetyltransferase